MRAFSSTLLVVSYLGFKLMVQTPVAYWSRFSFLSVLMLQFPFQILKLLGKNYPMSHRCWHLQNVGIVAPGPLFPQPCGGWGAGPLFL